MSDRSCHHTALTGCTHYFGIPKYEHARTRSSKLERNFVDKLEKIQMMCMQINTAGRNNWKCNKNRVIMIYVARQNLISTAHVDLNCGKTVSRAPPDWIFFPLCHQSSGSSDSEVPQRAGREQEKIKTINSDGYIEHHTRLEGKYEMREPFEDFKNAEDGRV